MSDSFHDSYAGRECVLATTNLISAMARAVPEVTKSLGILASAALKYAEAHAVIAARTPDTSGVMAQVAAQLKALGKEED